MMVSVLGEVTVYFQLNTCFWAEITNGDTRKYYRAKGWKTIAEGTADEISEEKFINDINTIKQFSGDFAKMKAFYDTLA